MLIGIARGLIVIAAGLWLAGCSTSTSFSNLLGSKSQNADASAAQASADPSTTQEPADASTPERTVEETTGTVPPPLGVPPASEKGLLPFTNPIKPLLIRDGAVLLQDIFTCGERISKRFGPHPPVILPIHP